MAKLYFRYGAMNCGKSTVLMQVAYNYEQNNMGVIVIKSVIDTKADNYLESRIGLKRKVDILLGKDESLIPYMKEFKKNKVKCILVDESQFMNSNQIEELWSITKLLDIPVICYGIKVNFKSELFEGSKRLLELADEMDELITVCKCGKKAKFNARYVNGEMSLEGDTILIDGSQKEVVYKPMCGKCFLIEKLKNKHPEYKYATELIDAYINEEL